MSEFKRDRTINHVPFSPADKRLIAEYKAYDAKQKELISSLYVEIGKLRSELDEYISNDTLAKLREKCKEQKAQITLLQDKLALYKCIGDIEVLPQDIIHKAVLYEHQKEKLAKERENNNKLRKIISDHITPNWSKPIPGDITLPPESDD